jgi:hypothetical protein
MARTLRYLRIAFSVACGIACVLLIALWLRSYWWKDGVWVWYPPNMAYAQATSERGSIYLVHLPFNSTTRIGWGMSSRPARTESSLSNKTMLGFHFKQIGDPGTFQFIQTVPHWFPLLLVAAVGCLPWIHWSKRFSLRTLLIATTLIAAVLGLVVYASR